MAWLPAYGEGLAGWGSTPQLHAAPVEDLIRSIWQLRQQQQQGVQNSLVGAINQFKNDQVANALTQQYQQSGLIPQDAFSGMGTAGATAAQKYIDEQQKKTYPTDVGGDQDLNLTGQQGLAYAIAKMRTDAAQKNTQARIDAAKDISSQATGLQPDPAGSGALGYYGKSGRWYPGPGYAQPGYGKSSQNQQSKAQAQQSNALLKEYGILSKRQDTLDTLSQIEQANNAKASKPDVPFSKADEYNSNAARMKAIQGQLQGGAAPVNQPNTSDPRVARAMQALNDPEATPEEKAQARQILGQQ